MYDLLVPSESYKREIDKLKVLAASAGSDGSTGNSNMTKGRKEHEKYNTLIDKLQVCLFFLYISHYNVIFHYINDIPSLI